MPEDIDELALALSSEVAVVCDDAGVVRWADKRAEHLLALQPGSVFLSLAASGSEIKAQAFLDAARTATTDVWELVLEVNQNPVVMFWRGAPLPDGAVLIGSVIPQHYGLLQDQMTGVVGDLTVLQRETERRRRQLADAQKENERLLAAERAARTEADSARKRAETASRTRDTFMRSLAHDLKTPLVGVSWSVDVLERSLRERNLELLTLAPMLESIRAGATEAMSTIDELHDLTLMAEGESFLLQREPVDLVGYMERIVSAQPASQQRTLTFESSVRVLAIDIDAARLTRAIRNLLDNAAKYSPPHQPVTVRLERQTCDGAVWATISVQDRGIGIPEADLPHIFEVYYRGNNAESISGQGLGLASVLQTVEMHGGRVEVRSRPGGGSVFTMWLPVGSTDATFGE